MQNAYANSRSVKHQRPNLLCCVLLRLKRSVNDTEPIKITGYVVKNIVICKMSGRRLTGIAQILLRKMQNLAACKAAQIHAHQILSVLHPLVIEHSRSGQSELKILVSVVRFRPRPPFQHPSVTSTTVFLFLQYADLHCVYDQHTLATVKFRDLSWTD